MSAGMELSTPMDIKMGLTSAADVAHPLRWGFMTAGRICADMAQACLIAAGRGCGATLGAGNPQRFSRRANTVRKLVSGPSKSVSKRRKLGRCWGAVAARKVEDAEAFAKDLGCARFYGGDDAYAEICADPEIDICYVVSRRDIAGIWVAFFQECQRYLLRAGHHHCAAHGARAHGHPWRQARVSTRTPAFLPALCHLW